MPLRSPQRAIADDLAGWAGVVLLALAVALADALIRALEAAP